MWDKNSIRPLHNKAIGSFEVALHMHESVTHVPTLILNNHPPKPMHSIIVNTNNKHV